MTENKTETKDMFVVQETPDSPWNFEFIRHFKNTQILGIGESLHASEGYLRTKTEITKHLIEYHAFRHILIEQPDASLDELRDFISNKNKINAKQAIKKLYTVLAIPVISGFFSLDKRVE